MRKTTVKSYGKINLSLNILGVDNGYHILDSVVCSINEYDVINLKSRKDNKILISFSGKYSFDFENQEDTLAYKTAKLFMDTYNTSGIDIDITCNIMPGGGFGSGSAEIAGILKGMKKLFKIEDDIKYLADSLGSDSGYQLTGGFARIKNRGEVVENFKVENKLYFVCLLSDSGVSTKECFKAYDEDNYSGVLSNNDELISSLIKGDIKETAKNLNNALMAPAFKLNNEIKKNLEVLKSLNPLVVSMTGSGATVFSIYENEELSKWAYDKLKKQNYNVLLLSSENS